MDRQVAGAADIVTLVVMAAPPSWPGKRREAPSRRLKSRPSTSSLPRLVKTWMPGIKPGMTNNEVQR